MAWPQSGETDYVSHSSILSRSAPLPYQTMKLQINSAVRFLSAYCPKQKDAFAEQLTSALQNKLSPMWYPDQPLRASALRTISIIEGKPDKLLKSIIDRLQIPVESFPPELALFIDPDHVAFRSGENGNLMDIWTEQSGSRPAFCLPPRNLRAAKITMAAKPPRHQKSALLRNQKEVSVA